MASTYRAVVDGEHIRWIDRPPIPAGEVEVRVVVVDKAADPTSASRVVREALQRLADRGGIGGITDPATWQRSERFDRPLPGRER